MAVDAFRKEDEETKIFLGITLRDINNKPDSEKNRLRRHRLFVPVGWWQTRLYDFRKVRLPRKRRKDRRCVLQDGGESSLRCGVNLSQLRIRTFPRKLVDFRALRGGKRLQCSSCARRVCFLSFSASLRKLFFEFSSEVPQLVKKQQFLFKEISTHLFIVTAQFYK